MSSYRDRLINQETGEICIFGIREVARERANRDYRGEAPWSWVMSEIENLKTEAYFVRRNWRRDHGLPDDTVYVTGFTIIEPRRGSHA